MPNATADAFADLYTARRGELVQLALDNLNEMGLDPHLAEDVVQDIAVRWYSKEHGLRSGRAAFSYVRRAIHNRCLDLTRDPWATRDEFAWLDEEAS